MSEGHLKQYMFERTEINIATYQPENIRQSFTTEREARQEYTRLRSTAQKRIERLEKVAQEDSYFGREAKKVLEDVGRFDKLKDIHRQDVYTQLERVAKFLHSKRSSVSTFRKSVTEEYRKALADPNTQKALRYLRAAKNGISSGDASEFASLSGDLDFLDDDEFFESLTSGDVMTTEDEDFEDLSQLFDIWDIMRNLNLGNLRYNEGALKSVYQNRGADSKELILKIKENFND